MPLSAVELAARRLIKNSNQEIIVMMKNSDGNWNISGDSHNMRTMTSTYGDEPSIYQNIKQDLEANVNGKLEVKWMGQGLVWVGYNTAISRRIVPFPRPGGS